MIPIYLLKRYPKEFKKLMKKNYLYIFKLNYPTSQLLDKFKNNETINADLLFFEIYPNVIYNDDILSIIKNKESIDSNLIIVKSAGNCKYFEELLTGERIPIWYMQENYWKHDFQHIKQKFYSNIKLRIDNIPPYFIPIYACSNDKAKLSLNPNVDKSVKISDSMYTREREHSEREHSFLKDYISKTALDYNILDNFDYNVLHEIIEAYKLKHIDTNQNDKIIDIKDELNMLKENLEKIKDEINKKNNKNEIIENNKEIKKVEYLKELKNNRLF